MTCSSSNKTHCRGANPTFYPEIPWTLMFEKCEFSDKLSILAPVCSFAKKNVLQNFILKRGNSKEMLWPLTASILKKRETFTVEAVKRKHIFLSLLCGVPNPLDGCQIPHSP